MDVFFTVIPFPAIQFKYFDLNLWSHCYSHLAIESLSRQ